eukprot:749534-Hanusia_phi.AAC.2
MSPSRRLPRLAKSSRIPPAVTHVFAVRTSVEPADRRAICRRVRRRRRVRWQRGGRGEESCTARGRVEAKPAWRKRHRTAWPRRSRRPPAQPSPPPGLQPPAAPGISSWWKLQRRPRWRRRSAGR